MNGSKSKVDDILKFMNEGKFDDKQVGKNLRPPRSTQNHLTTHAVFTLLEIAWHRH